LRTSVLWVAVAILVASSVSADPVSAPDPRIASSTAGHSDAPYPPSPPPSDAPARARSETDLPETPSDDPCWCTHLIYFRPKDKPDQRLDTNGTIDASVRSLRAWFVQQMKKQPRFDRLGGTNLFDITHVLGTKEATAYTSLASITEELRAKGLNEPSKRYLIYASIDRGTTCGEATYPYVGLTVTTYAAIYLDSAPCSSRDFGNGTAAGSGMAETIVAHEWLHADGVVAPSAPHHCPTSMYHVCTGPLWMIPTSVAGSLDPEQPDVLYPLIDARLSKKVLDRDRDDYLDHPWLVHPNLRNSAYLEPGA
jgi:hypothetical protein